METREMVVDTSIFIEYLRAKDKKKSILFAIPDATQLYISSVTMYELLMGATDENKQKDIKLLTEDLPVLPFDESISKKAAEIYHQLRLENNMIDFRDIFIAATCIVFEMPLKSLNRKHFERIKGLYIQ
jgi:tRNA(fMet)-specific endonuclease VapC